MQWEALTSISLKDINGNQLSAIIIERLYLTSLSVFYKLSMDIFMMVSFSRDIRDFSSIN